MKTKNLTNGAEVKNEILTFKASIFQLSKDGQDTTFELILQGTAAKNDDNLFVKVAELLAKQTFLLFQEQNNICEKTNKHRVYKFAAGKPVHFYFQLNGETLFNTEFFNSLKVKLSGLTSAEQLQIILDSLIRVITSTSNIVL